MHQDITTSKASLDPYRIESKKILSIFRGHCERVEKASVDESFLDLSRLVGERVRERFGALLGSPPYGDPTERMPLPKQEVDWSGSTLVEVDDPEGRKEGDGGSDTGGDKDRERERDGEERAALDWSDVCLAIGAEIVSEIRKEVREKLKYTCSAGIAGNKMLAKLASGYKKPDNQTVVRAKAVGRFLSNIKVTKSSEGPFDISLMQKS